MSQYYTELDHLALLPAIMLAIFGCAILLFDTWLYPDPKDRKYLVLAPVIPGLGLMALCFYIMVGFLRGERRSNEAAIKYLILGAFSSGFLAYGFSLMYGISGSTKLREIAAAISSRDPWDPVVFLMMATTSIGLLFKISAVPFHMWAPDAYEGAPTTITAY